MGGVELLEAVRDVPQRRGAQLAVLADAGAAARGREYLLVLVMGSRGSGPLHAVLTGGVSGPVLRGASCPVVVTPRAMLPDRRDREGVGRNGGAASTRLR